MVNAGAVYLAEVRRIVLEGLRGHAVRVYLFGSQAHGSPVRTSDIDVGVLPLNGLPTGLLSTIRDRLQDSTVPYEVDLVDLSRAGADFRRRVEQEGLLWTD